MGTTGYGPGVGVHTPVRALADQPAEAPAPRAGVGRRPGFRTDIQALRALAVSLVVAYHLWPDTVRGGFIGVDVFFVISGFLISSHLYAHPPRSVADLAAFWARRARRLLPAALVVLVVTLAAALLVLPATQWSTTAHEVVAATLYVENWQLYATSVDYLAAAGAPSPVQHFWSLSVEEQFYVVWPLALLGLVVLARVRRWPRWATVGLGLGLLSAASLLYCLVTTAVEPAQAYFVTPSRLWELGAGALLAVVGARPRVTRTWRLADRARLLLLATGLALVVVPALVYTSALAFPGWRATLPVVGTLLVVAAAVPRAQHGPGRWSAVAPVQKLGDISYSVYLWHWPLVVLVPYALGHDLAALDKLGVLAASLVLGWVSKVTLEDRFRVPVGTPGRTLRRAALAMAVVVTLAGVLLVQTSRQERADERRLAAAVQTRGSCFGAAALAAGAKACPPTTGGPVVPSAVQAPKDKSEAYDRDCFTPAPFGEVRRCVFGDPQGKVSVALVGNSHAGHWLPAVERVAQARGWRVTTFLASECTATTTPVVWDSDAKQQGCLRWADQVRSATAGQQFDLVVTSERNGRAALGRTYEASYPDWLAGYRASLAGWVRSGTRVLVIADTATPGATLASVPDCMAEHPDDLAACSGPRERWVPRDPLVEAARAAGSPRVQTVDLNDYLCDADRCAAAVGGVTVYSDASHLTRTYATTLAPYLEPAMLRAAGLPGG